MTKILKITFLSMCCMVLLAACGKKEETKNPQESANIGDIINKNQPMGQESPECPGIYEPVCVKESIKDGEPATYKNACHAELLGEKAWQPGEC